MAEWDTENMGFGYCEIFEKNPQIYDQISSLVNIHKLEWENSKHIHTSTTSFSIFLCEIIKSRNFKGLFYLHSSTHFFWLLKNGLWVHTHHDTNFNVP